MLSLRNQEKASVVKEETGESQEECGLGRIWRDKQLDIERILDHIIEFNLYLKN